MHQTRTTILCGLVLVASILTGTPATHAQELQQEVQWTGFYAGVHAGAAMADYDFDSRFGEVENGDFRSDLAAGGVQLGYDWQRSGIVLGLGGRFTFLENEPAGAAGASFSGIGRGPEPVGPVSVKGAAGAEGRGTQPSDAGFTTIEKARVEAFTMEAEWSAAAEGRAGYALGRLLPFVTGGLALGQVETRYVAATIRSVNHGPAEVQRIETVDEKNVQVGYTIGTGLEVAATPNISLRGDYAFADLGTRKYVFDGSDNEADFATKLHSFRFGANYRF